MERDTGFEPVTTCLESRLSLRLVLSFETIKSASLFNVSGVSEASSRFVSIILLESMFIPYPFFSIVS